MFMMRNKISETPNLTMFRRSPVPLLSGFAAVENSPRNSAAPDYQHFHRIQRHDSVFNRSILPSLQVE
jgi:hypothetical protein